MPSETESVDSCLAEFSCEASDEDKETLSKNAIDSAKPQGIMDRFFRRSKRKAALTQAAGRNGVDRIVKLGRMHVFGSPWDGADLVRPMVRLVRHLPGNSD